MVAIWWGTQADEAFQDAWHSDTGTNPEFRSKVYFSPRLWYLRVGIIEAQDLIPPDRSHLPVPVSSFFGSTNMGCFMYVSISFFFFGFSGFALVGWCSCAFCRFMCGFKDLEQSFCGSNFPHVNFAVYQGTSGSLPNVKDKTGISGRH